MTLLARLVTRARLAEGLLQPVDDVGGDLVAVALVEHLVTRRPRETGLCKWGGGGPAATGRRGGGGPRRGFPWCPPGGGPGGRGGIGGGGCPLPRVPRHE